MQHVTLLGVGAGILVASVALVWSVRRLQHGKRTSGAIGALVVLGSLVAMATGAQTAFGGELPTAAPTPSRSAPPTPASQPPTAAWSPQVLPSGPGYAHITRLRLPAFPGSLSASALRLPETLPAHGVVGSVVIPATRSHFTARPAIVYLPPAALVPQPRLLPVVVAFSGQSRGAGPRDLVWSGHLRELMDTIAAAHDGVAPIVVVPDQLGPATDNPMCVDSRRFGDVATYVMRDVRSWILDRLPVEQGRLQWTVAGFSEGGTCAVQFAAAHPDVFGSFVDVSGEEAPTNGTLRHTIEVGFGGDREAYLRATPAWILTHHRYRDEQAYFAAGARDRDYGPVAPWMARCAHAAGMTTHRLVVPDIAHNWRTAEAGFRWAFDDLIGAWGI